MNKYKVLRGNILLNYKVKSYIYLIHEEAKAFDVSLLPLLKNRGLEILLNV